jgi:hypothetical protein
VRCRRVLLALAHFAWQIDNDSMAPASIESVELGFASSLPDRVPPHPATTTAERNGYRMPVQGTDCWNITRSLNWQGVKFYFGSMRLSVNEPATSMQGVIAGGQGGLMYTLFFPERMSLGLQRHSNPTLVATDGSRTPLVPQAIPTRATGMGAVEGVVPCNVSAFELHVGAHRTIVASLSDLQDFIIGVEDISVTALKQSSRVASDSHEGPPPVEATGCCCCGDQRRVTIIRSRETMNSLALRRCCLRPAACCGVAGCCQKSRFQRFMSAMCCGRQMEAKFEISSILLFACACALYSVSRIMPNSLALDIALGFYKFSVTIALVFNGYNASVALTKHLRDTGSWNNAPKRAVFQFAVVVLSSVTCSCAFAVSPDGPHLVALASPLLLVFLASPHVNKMMRRTMGSVLLFTPTMVLIFTVCNSFAFAGYWMFGVYFKMDAPWAQQENPLAAKWFDSPYHAFLLFFGMLIGAPWSPISQALQQQLNSVWPAFVFCAFIALGRVIMLNLLLGNLVDSYRGTLDTSDERHLEKAVKEVNAKHAIVLFAISDGRDDDAGQCVVELVAPVARTSIRARVPQSLRGVDSVEMKQNPIHQERGHGVGLHEPLLGGGGGAALDDESTLQGAGR